MVETTLSAADSTATAAIAPAMPSPSVSVLARAEIRAVADRQDHERHGVLRIVPRHAVRTAGALMAVSNITGNVTGIAGLVWYR